MIDFHWQTNMHKDNPPEAAIRHRSQIDEGSHK